MKIKLNLIPEYKKEEISQGVVFLKIMRWNIEFSFVYISFILILFAMGYILKLNLLTNEIQLNPNNIAKYSEFKQYDTEIKEMNGKVEEIKKIQSGQLYWTKFFAKLNELVTDGIIIDNIATKDYRILLVGKSTNRDNLITFKEKIETDNCFADVDLPLSYLVPRENLDFQINFSLKKECLRQIDGQ